MFNTMKTGMYCMTSGAKRLGGMAVLAVATPPLLVASFVGGTVASIKTAREISLASKEMRKEMIETEEVEI